MKKTIIALAFLMSIGIHAQHNLGKVTKEELEQKNYPQDTSAVAAILFNVGKTTFDYTEDDGFVIVTEVKTKIKIYKKEGYAWANKAVPYYIDGSSDKVTFSDCATYNLVDGKVVKTKLKGEGEFDEKVNRFWSQKKITLPNVKEGSIVEYSFRLKSPRIWKLSDWDFQMSIPVKYSEYTAAIPEYLVYATRTKGFLLPKITSEKKPRTIQYSYKTEMMPGLNAGGMPERVQQTLEFTESVTNYVVENAPALKDESYVNNIENYTASIQHELSMTKYPRTPIRYFSTTWEDVVKTIYQSEDFGGELKKTGYFEDDVKNLIAGLSTEQKIGAIFSYVKGRMNWNDYTGYICNDGVRKAYKDKVGNVAEINLMLTAMLRYAGIDANPVLVSTRANGISYFPNRSAYNYVICAIELNNQLVLLDATSKYTLPNILPVRVLNWNGRILRDNGSSAEVSLMPKSASKDIVNMIASFDSQGKLSGKLKEQYFDYNAMLYRQNYLTLAKDSYLEKLEKKLEGIEISDDFAATSDDAMKPVTESYSFTHGNVSELIGDKIYFSPMLFFGQKENPFRQEKREYPVDFVFPNNDKYIFTITIPDGYAVESMPAPAAVTMGEGLGKFTFNITNAGNRLQIMSTFEINEAIVASEDYQMLKDFYKAMIDKQNEKIVLKKI